MDVILADTCSVLKLPEEQKACRKRVAGYEESVVDRKGGVKGGLGEEKVFGAAFVDC